MAPHPADFAGHDPQEKTTRSPHGPLAVPCENCHTAAGWRPIRAVPEFDHNKTNYPLRGMHEKVKCLECHVKPVFTNVGKNCADCHEDVHRRQMGPNCEQCHTVQGWNIAVQQVKDHQNRFPLLGAHAAVQCDECHKQAATGIFLGLSTQCDSCHLKDWQTTTNPPHAANPAAFPSASCQGCHTTFDSWLGAVFNGNHAGPPINFPLTGGHANVPCAQCHVGNNFHLQIALNDCGNAGCHLNTYNTTNNPPHASNPQLFPIANCSQCHDTIAWTDLSSFNHSATGFTLTGMHVSPVPTPCVSCHISNSYTLKIAPTDCGNSACHLTQWNSTATMGLSVPNHITAGFPITQCVTCHNTTSWATATFDHSTTGFPLMNAHATVACALCHVGGNYNLQKIAPTDCGNSGCHLTTWTNTNNPTHSTAGAAFAASNCSQCHDTIAWTDLTSFNHTVTGFALTGMHVSPVPAPCASCHLNGTYTNLPMDCGNSACHLTQWNSTATILNVPNHITAGFPIAQCATCHNTTSWATATFDHTTTGFALTGEHAVPPLTCAQCHVNGNYNLQNIAPTDCANTACHLTDWTNTNNPVHSAAVPTFAAANCMNCHTTTALFTTSSWNHSSTGWALMGNHQMTPAGAATNCNQCHVGNNYGLTNTDCYTSGCHTTDWNNTVTLGGAVPNHVAAQFPTSMCSTCHDTILWADGKFDHTTTGWALTGAHQMVPAAGGIISMCTQCHIGNNYSLNGTTDILCYHCHSADWLSTQTLGGSVPNHITAGYPTTCENCHTTTSWLGAVFNHTWFPIPHHSSVCNDCHQVSTDYTSFTCINCHTNTNAHRPGMSHPNVCSPSPSCWYQPTTCYNCHKNGGG